MNSKISCCFFVVFLVLGFTCFCQASLTDGLVASYPFKGDAKDVSGNGNHGTNHGATPTSDRFGKPGSAFYFDGVSNYIDIDKIASKLNGERTGSISIWFKTDEKVRSKALFSYHKNESFFSYIMLGDFTGYFANESIGGEIQPDQGFAYEKGNDFYMDGKWHHAVFVMGTKYNALYMDGEKVSLTYISTSNFAGNLNTGNIMWKDIAGAQIGHIVGYSTFYFKGSIDDVLIYKRELSEKEIKQIFTMKK